MKCFNSKSRITNVQATVVQLPNIAVSDKRGVFVCRAPFLFLFWRSKKENKKNNATCYRYQHYFREESHGHKSI